MNKKFSDLLIEESLKDEISLKVEREEIDPTPFQNDYDDYYASFMTFLKVLENNESVLDIDVWDFIEESIKVKCIIRISTYESINFFIRFKRFNNTISFEFILPFSVDDKLASFIKIKCNDTNDYLFKNNKLGYFFYDDKNIYYHYTYLSNWNDVSFEFASFLINQLIENLKLEIYSYEQLISKNLTIDEMKDFYEEINKTIEFFIED